MCVYKNKRENTLTISQLGGEYFLAYAGGVDGGCVVWVSGEETNADWGDGDGWEDDDGLFNKPYTQNCRKENGDDFFGCNRDRWQGI